MLLTSHSESRPVRARVWLWVGAAFVATLVVGAFVIEFGLTMPGGSAQQSIKVTKVYFDQVDAPSGTSYYVMDVNASNTASTAWHFDPSFLTMTSNSSATFVSDGSYNGTALLGVADIATGQHVVGKVAFNLPAKQGPAKLSYTDTKGVKLQVTTIPPVSAVASRFNYNTRMNVTGTGPTVQAQGWGFGSLIMNGVIENNTLVFFSGQKVQVNLWFEYLKRPVDPATITIQSVTAGNGFQILGVDKPVPFTMMGWGSQAGLVLLLKVPEGQHSGSIDLSVQVSA